MADIECKNRQGALLVKALNLIEQGKGDEAEIEIIKALISINVGVIYNKTDHYFFISPNQKN